MLTVHHGDIVVTAAGTVIDGLDVRGQITVKAANVTIKNSIVRGPLAGVSGSIFLILTTGQPGLQIIDTEIAASTPNQDVKGVGGSNYTLTRVNIHSVIDSVNVLGDNVTVERSWLHDNLDYGPDENGVGGPSHADSIQIQKGSHIRVHDNTISAGRNAGVMITQDRGPVADFSFARNAADGGACTINITEKSYGPIHGVAIEDNLFGRNTVHANCAIIAPDSTKALMRVSGNFYVPDYFPVTVRRGG